MASLESTLIENACHDARNNTCYAERQTGSQYEHGINRATGASRHRETDADFAFARRPGFNFLIAAGYTGQITENFCQYKPTAPCDPSSIQEVVGVRVPSYASATLTYRFGR